MPRIKYQKEEKPVRMELNLTPANAQKLAKVAISSKQNRTKIINRLVEEMDQSMAIFDAMDYIKSRELIFIEVAKLAQNLKMQQTDFANQINEVVASFKDYKNTSVEKQNSLTERLAKTEKLLIRFDDWLTQNEKPMFGWGKK